MVRPCSKRWRCRIQLRRCWWNCPKHRCVQSIHTRTERMASWSADRPTLTAQDINAGDGTTSVVVLAGALLKKSMELIEKGIHPTVISDAMNIAGEKACAILEENAIPVDLSDREALIQNATTSLGSKVVSQYSSVLAPMAVDCVLGVVDPATPNRCARQRTSRVCAVSGTCESWSRNELTNPGLALVGFVQRGFERHQAREEAGRDRGRHRNGRRTGV
mmetsp:Transcript_3767/g.23737  ORF Transcript_3767/g.23737 Transcript_3767/m.23737 type:complete len:219 (+) Transcript_3767:259-915(+)